MVKRQIRLRLSEDMQQLEYSTLVFAGQAGGGANTKTIAIEEIEFVQAGTSDEPLTWCILTAGRPHKFDAPSLREKKMWMKAVLDVMNLQLYLTDDEPFLHQVRCWRLVSCAGVVCVVWRAARQDSGGR